MAPGTSKRALFTQLERHIATADAPMAAVVIGPRQVGKTTLLRQLAIEALDAGVDPTAIGLMDLSDDRLPADVSLRDAIAAMPTTHARRILLIDEVQVDTNWHRVLKTLVDHVGEPGGLQRGDRLVLTGSETLHLRRGGVESGPGRWTEFAIEALTFSECIRLHTAAVQSDVEAAHQAQPHLMRRYLTQGGFPRWLFHDDLRVARQHLREDIIDRMVSRDLAAANIDLLGAKRLFVRLAGDSGSEFSATAVARDLGNGAGLGSNGPDRRTVDAWRAALLATGLLVELPRLSTNAAKTSRAKSKIYACDPGLVSVLSSTSDVWKDPAVRGRIVETAVFRHLRQLLLPGPEAINPAVERIGYLRWDKGKEGEVDFVLQTVDGLVCVEVTGGDSAQGKVQKLQRMTSKLKNVRVASVVHTGVHEDVQFGIKILPLHKVLLRPACVLEAP